MESYIEEVARLIRVLNATTRFSDLAKPMMFVLWLVILFFPLKGIDRRDPVGGMVYTLYAVAAGVALVFAIPQKYVTEKSTFTEQLSAILGFAIVAASRWIYGAEKAALALENKLQKHKRKKEEPKNGQQ